MKQIPSASMKYGHSYCDFSELWSEKVYGSTSSQVFPYNIFMFSKNWVKIIASVLVVGFSKFKVQNDFPA